jgi:hypothetical protein
MIARLMTATSAIALNFNRIASFMVAENTPDAEETSAEIISATADGMTLVYTDSPAGMIGFIDITDPPPRLRAPSCMNGEPTSVAVMGMTAYVGENTSESYTEPSGVLHAIDVQGRDVLGSCDLGGQPDSVAVARWQLCCRGDRERARRGSGRWARRPDAGGYLTITQTSDAGLDCDSTMMADLTGLADIAPEDPEPEFVSINGEGEIVVTLQENNHMVVVPRWHEVLSHFSAGEVTLEGVDTEEEARSSSTRHDHRAARAGRVTWIDDTHFATANEGDMDGGSRGWTIFSQDGEVVYEAA